MKNRTRNRRVLLWVKHLVVALGLVMGGRTVCAQDSRPIPRSYLNKGTVHLPIQIDDRARPQIQEVQLYVKEGPQAPWELKDKVPGTQTFFTYRTTKEGEYWFNVVTVDRAGRAIPADVSKEPPGLIVIIDSTPPQTDAHIVGTTPDGQQVRCEIRDANPDPSKTRFFYQTRDQIWRSLESTVGHPDTFCIPGQAALTGMIRVTACDLAGNATTRELNLAALPPANNTPFAVGRMPANLSMVDNANTAPPLPPIPALPDHVGAASKVVVPAVMNEKFTPGIETISNKVTTPPPPPPSLPGSILEQTSKTPFAVPSGSEGGRALAPSPDGPVAAGQLEVPAKRNIVNNSHVFLDYQIEQTGVSGVGRVEIWYTRDMGQNWQKLGEDPNHKGQAEADLPGEGIYGVTIVVSNGRGFGANPPQPGEAPDCWIEVDTTKPRAELLNVRSNPSGDDGSLHITWTAKDKNLHSEPIDLFYSVDRKAWLPIAKGLKNDGLYRWTPAADVGSHAFIKLTAHDQAGNIASSESVQPVTLDDLSRPRSRVVGITTAPRSVLGNGASPLPPNGN